MGVTVIVIVDNREQRPVLFDKAGDSAFPDMQITWGHLPTGDYSITGMDSPSCTHSICIERKSLSDLFGSTGRGRERFKREYERMAEFDYAALVIEADFRAIFQSPPPASMMHPKSVFRTIIAWCQRYNVHCFPCPDRIFAEKTIYLILKRFWDDRQLNGKMEFSKL